MNDFAPQGSPEWFAERLGKVTASRIADVAARTKTGYGASRANYMAELIIERLTGQKAPAYENDAMRWGSEQEALARLTYAFLNDVEVELAGFVSHPLIADCGCSPDGYVGALGLVEIKAPNTATHIDTLLTDAVAPEQQGRAFGFERAMDTTGAVLGPLCAAALLDTLGPRGV